MTGDTILIRNSIQAKIPQMAASKPLITCEDDLSPRGLLARFVYEICQLENDSDDKKEAFWNEWKKEVYRMMRLRKNYIARTIKNKTIHEIDENMYLLSWTVYLT